jgi:hypothetical protein
MMSAREARAPMAVLPKPSLLNKSAAAPNAVNAMSIDRIDVFIALSFAKILPSGRDRNLASYQGMTASQPSYAVDG